MYIPYGWASYGDEQYQQIESDSQIVRDYVNQGGGLFIEQPNPYRNGKDETVTPEILPYPITFNNTPPKFMLKYIDNDHPVTAGLTMKSVPFSGDSLLYIAPEYRVLIKGVTPESSPLLVALYGKGKILVCTHSASKQATHPTDDEIFIRMINWLARKAGE